MQHPKKIWARRTDRDKAERNLDYHGLYAKVARSQFQVLAKLTQ